MLIFVSWYTPCLVCIVLPVIAFCTLYGLHNDDIKVASLDNFAHRPIPLTVPVVLFNRKEVEQCEEEHETMTLTWLQYSRLRCCKLGLWFLKYWFCNTFSMVGVDFYPHHWKYITKSTLQKFITHAKIEHLCISNLQPFWMIPSISPFFFKISYLPATFSYFTANTGSALFDPSWTPFSSPLAKE